MKRLLFPTVFGWMLTIQSATAISITIREATARYLEFDIVWEATAPAETGRAEVRVTGSDYDYQLNAFDAGVRSLAGIGGGLYVFLDPVVFTGDILVDTFEIRNETDYESRSTYESAFSLWTVGEFDGVSHEPLADTPYGLRFSFGHSPVRVPDSGPGWLGAACLLLGLLWAGRYRGLGRN